MLEVVVICVVSIVAVELWRRHLVRTRLVPRWVSFVTWGLFAVAAVATLLAWLALRRAFDAVEAHAAAEKAIELARAISSAMNANVVSVIALACAAVLLGVVSFTTQRR